MEIWKVYFDGGMLCSKLTFITSLKIPKIGRYDSARKITFPSPSNMKDLEELAEHLSADMAPITDNFFDESVRKEHIYLFVQITDDLLSRRPCYSSASSLHFAIHPRQLIV